MGAETEAELMRQMTDMRRRGMTDEQILQTLAMQELEGTGIDVPSDVPEVLPRAGEEAWGVWSQSETTINLELCVDANTAAKSVCCEVNSGKLEVRVGESATLVGALTQQVYGEPDWTLDIRPDGQRVLCVELEKRKAAPDALAKAPALEPILSLLGDAASLQSCIDDAVAVLEEVGSVLAEVAGVAPADFRKVYSSFSVRSRVQQAHARGLAYRLSGTPTVIVDGTFRVDGRMAGSNTGILQVVDYLVAQRRGESGDASGE